MGTRLAPYGSEENADNVAKVGKIKTPRSLAARMPSADIVAKVGSDPVAAACTRRVIRRSARG